MSIKYLKVKIKSLAAEAAIIRREEREAYARGDMKTYNGLHNHRCHEVRSEARCTQLAYAYLRLKNYRDAEGQDGSETLTDYQIERIVRMVNKYGYDMNPYSITAKTILIWMEYNPNAIPVTDEDGDEESYYYATEEEEAQVEIIVEAVQRANNAIMESELVRDKAPLLTDAAPEKGLGFKYSALRQFFKKHLRAA